jgi:solute carrier family 35 protein C2
MSVIAAAVAMPSPTTLAETGAINTERSTLLEGGRRISIGAPSTVAVPHSASVSVEAAPVVASSACGGLTSRMEPSVAALLFYFVSSIALTIFNKWFFSSHNQLGFHFPLAVTSAHQLLVALMVDYFEPSLKRTGFGEITRAPELRVPLGFLGVLCGIDWGLSNLSLRYITLSLYEITKSASPAMVLIVSVVFGLLAVTKRILTITVLICVGMYLAVSGGTLDVFLSDGFPAFGFACVACATVMSGLRVVYAQHALQRLHLPGAVNPGVNAITMLHYAAPTSGATLIIPAIILEGRELGAFYLQNSWGQLGLVALCILGSATLAFALSLSEFVATRKTSALTLCVVGVTKQLLLIGLAMFVFGDRLGKMNILGFGVALSGVALYNYAKWSGGMRGGQVATPRDLRDPQDDSDGGNDLELKPTSKNASVEVSPPQAPIRTVAQPAAMDTDAVLRPRQKGQPSETAAGQVAAPAVIPR